MNRRLFALATALLPVSLAFPASAAPANHDVFVEETDTYEAFAAGDAEPCVPWAGTFHEVRSGEIKLVTNATGPHAGAVHANGVVAGYIEYIPDDDSLPTYTGSYREKLNAALLQLSFDDDQTRIAQFRLRSRLEGTDGSGLQLVLSGKVTLNGHGGVTVDRTTFTCD
jgi:hypothetical protein